MDRHWQWHWRCRDGRTEPAAAPTPITDDDTRRRHPLASSALHHRYRSRIVELSRRRTNQVQWQRTPNGLEQLHQRRRQRWRQAAAAQALLHLRPPSAHCCTLNRRCCCHSNRRRRRRDRHPCCALRADRRIAICSHSARRRNCSRRCHMAAEAVAAAFITD